MKVAVAQWHPLFVTPRTVACQAPLSKEFSRQDYWSGLPFPSPGDLLDLGIKPRFPALQADFFFFLPSEPLGKPDYPPNTYGSLVPYAHGNHSAHLVLTVEGKSEIKVQIHKASLKPLGGPSHAFL